METYNEMLERQRKEMGDVLIDQATSWKALREQYGETIPIEVSQQWEQQYGQPRQAGLAAWHHAQLETYPMNPMEYRYQNEPQAEKQPEPTKTIEPKVDVFEQLKQQQQAQEQQRVQDLNEKLIPDVKMETAAQRQAEEKKMDVFEQLKRQQEQQERDHRGHEYER